MTRSLRLVSTNPAPAIVHMPVALPKREPKPLISKKARETEAAGKSFYERVNLKPQDLPSMYLALSAYPKRVVRRHVFAIVPSLIGVALFLMVVGAVLGAM